MDCVDGMYDCRLRGQMGGSRTPGGAVVDSGADAHCKVPMHHQSTTDGLQAVCPLALRRP